MLPGMRVGVVLSFLACALVLLLRAPATGALHHYTDPVRQPVCALLALEFGADVYRVPYGELLGRAHLRRPVEHWPAARYVYPPGALLAFIPPALVGQWTGISDPLYRRLCGVWVALLAHVGLWFAVGRLRVLPSGWRVLAAVLTWLFVARTALNGQYEPLWLAPAALGLGTLEREREGPALGWIAVAWATHYRAVVLLPFAMIALVRLVRARSGLGWGVAFVLSGLAVTACARWGLASPFRAEPPLYTRPTDALFWLDLGATAFGCLVAGAVARDRALAATIALVGATALLDGPHWWHASAVFLPVLARGAAVEWRRPASATAGLVLWMLLAEAVWLYRPMTLLGDLREVFRGEQAARLAPPAPAMSRAAAGLEGSTRSAVTSVRAGAVAEVA